MAEVILEFEAITKRFFGITALEDVNLHLRKGRLLGLIGENGAGKSTLMNILGGVFSPDSGTMRIDGDVYAPKNPADAIARGVAFIHQELNLFTNLSIAENIFITSFPKVGRLPLINTPRIVEKTVELLDSINLNLSPQTTVESLAPGEKQLVEIAKALSADARIIIFDEPTTSLTAKETERLFDLIEQLRADGRSIIYISHILGDVQKLADDVAVLRDGRVVDTDSIANIDVNRMITRMVGRDIHNMFPPKISTPADREILNVEGVSQTGIVRDIHFDLKQGEILGIFGLMGSGRTELARMIFGIDEYETGRIFLNGNLLSSAAPQERIQHGMAFVTEDRRAEGLLMNVSIAENIGLVALAEFAKTILKLIRVNQLYAAVNKIVASLRIKTASAETLPAKSLSGGNQQKVVLGKWLMTQPRVLLMDEPTRGIDVGAKYEIYTIMGELASQGTGVLVISSELEELIGMCDRILVMSRGEIMTIFDRQEFDQVRILHAAFREDNGNTQPIREGELSV